LNLPIWYSDAIAAVARLYVLRGVAFASAFTAAHKPSL
jgi:hypothetical protein